MSKIIVAGIGPGSAADITPAVLDAVAQSDAVVGYKHYFQYIKQYVRPDALCIDTGMKRERERAEEAFRLAREGRTVCVISSGDAGIYGMAPLIHEMALEQGDTTTEIVCLPGISAFQKAASLLGAPIGHDLCLISLSDLMTPWEVIERRIRAAVMADFVTAVYNPRSHGRYWQLHRLQELFLQERKGSTPVGYVKNAGRDGQTIVLTTLAEFDPEDVDMFTVVLIGNSQSYIGNGRMITPRGYYAGNAECRMQNAEFIDNSECRMQNAEFGKNAELLPSGADNTAQPNSAFCIPHSALNKDSALNKGQSIMIASFQKIRSELRNPDLPLWRLWPMLHAIHTTADFDMERLLWMTDQATAILYNKVRAREVDTIVTDVTMAASGIRKGALERLGIRVVTFINDDDVAQEAKAQGITRAQAAMRKAARLHPQALYAFGNAPTALLELCDLVRHGQANPTGIVAAPVGFVHVEESKHAVKTLRSIPKIVIEGRKGGSNLAATLVNSILTYDDAANLLPGRDV